MVLLIVLGVRTFIAQCGGPGWVALACEHSYEVLSGLFGVGNARK